MKNFNRFILLFIFSFFIVCINVDASTLYTCTYNSSGNKIALPDFTYVITVADDYTATSSGLTIGTGYGTDGKFSYLAGDESYVLGTYKTNKYDMCQDVIFCFGGVSGMGFWVSSDIDDDASCTALKGTKTETTTRATTTKRRVTNEANNACHIYTDSASCNVAEQGCIWSFTDNACYQKSSSSSATTTTSAKTELVCKREQSIRVSRNGEDSVTLYFYKRGTEKFWKAGSSVQMPVSSSISYNGNSYSLSDDVISEVYDNTHTSTSCTDLILYFNCDGGNASGTGSASITVQKTKPDDANNCGYSVTDAEYDNGLSEEAKATSSAVIYEQEDYAGQNVGDGVCSDSNFIRGFKIIGALLMVAKCAIPLIIIIIGSVNMFKAVTSDNSDELVKRAKNLGFRIAIGIAVFFLPSIILAFTNMTGLVPEEYQECSKCVLNITECDS